MKNFKLDRKKSGLLIVDVQEKLFPLVERSCEVLKSIQKLIKALKILHVPIYYSEQYPQGLGPTIPSIKILLDSKVEPFQKTEFSCASDQNTAAKLLALPVDQWIVVGIETHVCVLQTVRDLLHAGKQVVVLNDAITSRSIFDYSTAIAEMRDMGARISSVETVIFELLHDSKDEHFKKISQLIKSES
jgi:nicotinamidase-related amidase